MKIKIFNVFYEKKAFISKERNRCLKKLNMVVIRVNNSNQLTNSKPCCNCIYYLRLYGIKNIYYSNENGEIIKEKISEIETNHTSISHTKYLEFLKTDSVELLSNFDKTYRKKKKFPMR